MQIDTQRFGTLEFNTDHLFTFPQGLIGMETLRQWAMIPDADNPSVAWLQSASRGDRAIAVISPKAFCPDYRVRTTKRALASLQLRGNSELYVLTVVSGHVGKLTTNLRAPLMLNLHRRIGCQIITNDDQELRRSLPSASAADHSRRDGRLRADQAGVAATPAERPAVAPRRAA